MRVGGSAPGGGRDRSRAADAAERGGHREAPRTARGRAGSTRDEQQQQRRRGGGDAVTRSVYVSKVRVYELAKETGLPNKEVIRRLGELGVEAKSHSSTVEEGDASLPREPREAAGGAPPPGGGEGAREAEEYDLAALQTPAGRRRRVGSSRRTCASSRRGRPLRRTRPRRHGRAVGSRAEQPSAPPRFRPATPFRPSGAPGGVSVGGDKEKEERPAAEAPPAAPAAPAAERPETPATSPPSGRPPPTPRGPESSAPPAPPKPPPPAPPARARSRPPAPRGRGRRRRRRASRASRAPGRRRAPVSRRSARR
jgi:translation initiation factor IF-2